MLSLITAAYVAPSVYFSYQLYKDRKYSEQFLKSDLVVFDPVEKEIFSVHVPSKINYLASFAPGMRIIFYNLSVSKSLRTFENLVEILNFKIICEHCGIVAANHSFEVTSAPLGKCSFCEKETNLIIVDGDDDNYPGYVRKTKKEIEYMLKKRSVEMPLIKKCKTIDDQYERLKKVNESKHKISLVEDPILDEYQKENKDIFSDSL